MCGGHSVSGVSGVSGTGLVMKGHMVVVGGGLQGTALAYEAAKRGYSVDILERPQSGEAYRAAAGMLAPISEAEPVLEPLTRFGLESLRLYSDFIEELESRSGERCDFQARGALHVAVSHDQLSLLNHIQAIQESMGLRTEWLDADEARELEPRLSPRMQGALLLRDEAQLDPMSLMTCLRAAMSSLHIRRHSIEAVDRFLLSEGRACGVCARLVEDASKPAGSGLYSFDADQVIVAGGAWTHQIPGLEYLPLRPVKGQVLRVKGERLLTRTVRTPDVYLVPRSSGRIWIGASVEEVGYDPTPRAGEVMELLWEARRVLPGVTELEFEGVVAGFRPTLRDHLPAIGAAGPPGLWLSTGHYRNGVLLLPATIRYLLDAVETGDSSPLLAPFSPLRFSETTL